MPIIFSKIPPASSGDFPSFTPPPLPRPPAWICAFTTHTFLSPERNSRAAAIASSLDWTSLPRGTATPYPRKISFAWYSWIFMGGGLYTARSHRASGPAASKIPGLRRPAPPFAEQRLEPRALHRPAQMVSLRIAAPQLAQDLELPLVLHPFRHHLHVQALRQREDGVDDLQRLLGLADALDEAAVDLQGVDGELVQVGERRVAGAEVVEVDAHSHRPELGHVARDLRVLFHQQRLGHFQPQGARREARLAQHFRHVGEQAGALELAGAEVHAHLQRGQPRPALPLLQLPASLAQHPRADGDDQARLLGERDEVHGRNHSALRMLPAEQRLRTRDPAR